MRENRKHPALAIAVLAAAFGLTSPTHAQSGVDSCAIAELDPSAEMGSRWGGEQRGLFSLTLNEGADRHVWSVGDGGVIRHSLNEGPWESQLTPDEASSTLMDVFFLPNGSKGWACGGNGVVLVTEDLGATWTFVPGASPYVCRSECTIGSGLEEQPAMLWRVRFLDANNGFVAGLWTLKCTMNGGVDWFDVSMQPGALPRCSPPTNIVQGEPCYDIPENPMCYEFYGLEVRRDWPTKQWVAFVTAQIWTPNEANGSCPADYLSEPVPHGGAVFRASGSIVVNGEGPLTFTGLQDWNCMFLEEKYNDERDPTLPLLELNDMWDLTLDPETNIPGAIGYVAGGNTTDDGTVLRFVNGGMQESDYSFDWGGTQEILTNPLINVRELYGITALSGGRVVACGYGGEIWMRHSDGTWKRRYAKYKVPGTNPAVYEKFTGPMGRVAPVQWETDGGTYDLMTVGSFGYMAATQIPPTNCSSSGCQLEWIQPYAAAPPSNVSANRLNDLYFHNEGFGLAVGQHVMLAQTLDGGCTWTPLFGGSAELPKPPATSLISIAFRNNKRRGIAVGRTGLVRPIHFYDYPDLTKVNAPLVQTDTNFAFEDVAHVKGTRWVAVGEDRLDSSGLIAVSGDHGGTWARAQISPGGPDLSDVTLMGITFLSSTEAFAVGYIGDEDWNLTAEDLDEPRAYRLTLGSGTTTNPITVEDVTPYTAFPTSSSNPGLATGRLLGVHANQATGKVWAVGGPHVVTSWNSTSGAFEVVNLNCDCDADCSSGNNCTMDFRSIHSSPDGATVLVGLEGSVHEHQSREMGVALRSQDNGSTWDWVRSRTNKDALRTFVLDSQNAWMVVGADQRSSTRVPDQEAPDGWDRPDIDKEWGSVGDAGIVYYSPSN